ncbi:eCIS core domain-containing protein [Shewanella surugensis]|uniref:DUF4157 domain-containing protein n=1 Tax=Shewanella surugensis TaxID=212020 RepID=A0ABT0L883_9GAMM|nr:DUF4157 domain-containing protein [Shewanella surugensis]MCL1123381.1 DUF4157 domain-containing protein [Shewanella surugensis]
MPNNVNKYAIKDPQSHDKVHPKKSLTSNNSFSNHFIDNRPEAALQRKYQLMANNSPQAARMAQLQSMADHHAAKQPIQKADTNINTSTGLPDNLKIGMEGLSGISLDHVKVHYNSPKPAAVQAHAYAQGNDIHLSTGQEKHLPHELGHVVQQAQGRVKPTTTVGGLAVNDNVGLEKEADVMGAKALQMQTKEHNRWAVASSVTQKKSKEQQVIQAVLNKEHVEEAKTLLGLQDAKVIEVPKSDKVSALMPFSKYAHECTYGLAQNDLTHSIASINFGDKAAEYADASAHLVLSLCGGAGYVKGLAFVSEGMKDYQRCLTHELGHHKQNISQGYNSDNTTIMLLEWHNVLYNENLFDPNKPRIAYGLDSRPSQYYERQDTAAKEKSDESKRHSIQVAMQKVINSEYQKLDVAVKKMGTMTKKTNDLKVYTEVYLKFEEIRQHVNEKSYDECFVYRCMQLNILSELSAALAK